MYRPMSIQLIRQALQWEGLKPLRVECVSTFKWPDGSTSGHYAIVFDGAYVRNRTGMPGLWDGSAAFMYFKGMVREAFADDCQITGAHVNAEQDTMLIDLFVKVFARDPMAE